MPTCRQLAAATAAVFTLHASSACSTSLPMRPIHVAEVQIIDRTSGERLPIYGHAGERWVAGTPGHRYAIEVQNRTGARVLAVVAVDGVNVVSGETAGWGQRGYVFSAGERYAVDGWRKNDQQVAGFEFAALPDSYAARTGRPDNVGVIGIALFRELVPPPPPPAALSEQAPAPVPFSAAPRAAAKAGDAVAAPQAAERGPLGTAHGGIESSVVTLTSFERAQATPNEIITIRYDRRENLIAQGILPPPIASATPSPFPLSSGGYVPDPPAR